MFLASCGESHTYNKKLSLGVEQNRNPMSNTDKALWSQANHTLTLIGQQHPTAGHIKVLHDGALTDLVQAIMNGSLPNRDEVRAFYGLPPIEEEVSGPASVPFIPFRDNLSLGATMAKPTASLFKDGRGVRYYYRDDCLDSWFSETSPATGAGIFQIVTTPKVMTLREMTKSATGLITDSIGDLSRAIVATGFDVAPAQFEEQIVATQAGGGILLTNGSANFAFVKTGKVLKDEKGDYDEVVVLYARRSVRGEWRASVDGLAYSREWGAGRRFLLRNGN